MTTPSLNTFLEEKLKEFNKKYPQLFDSAGEYEGYTCDMTEDVWSFISASISEAWELKNQLEVDNG